MKVLDFVLGKKFKKIMGWIFYNEINLCLIVCGLWYVVMV